MSLGNVAIQREVERQLKESLDKRFDAFSAQFTEQLAEIDEKFTKVTLAIVHHLAAGEFPEWFGYDVDKQQITISK